MNLQTGTVRILVNRDVWPLIENRGHIFDRAKEQAHKHGGALTGQYTVTTEGIVDNYTDFETWDGSTVSLEDNNLVMVEFTMIREVETAL